MHLSIARVVLGFVCLLPAAGAALGQDLSLPGPFAPGWRSVTVVRANNTTFTARLFYPGTAPGQNAALNSAGVPYPAVSFGHGFLQTVDRYQSTLEHLATWGFIVIASDSEGSLFPSHSNFALDMRQCLTYLEQQNAQPASFLFGAINTGRFGMSGHSMGGGCSILAASADTRVKALANLAAAETNPSAAAQMPNIAIPVDLVCGSSDTIVPVASNGQVMYNGGKAPKLLQVIQGGFHCGFEDLSTIGCDSGPLPRAEQLAITRRLLTSFFTLYLKNGQSSWSQFWGPDRSLDARVLTTADPGIQVSPSQATLGGFQFSTAVATLNVTNSGAFADSFAIVSDDAQWGTTFAPSQTPLLAPGGSAEVEVRVTVPQGFPPAFESLLATARSVRDSGTRAFARVDVQRWCLADLDRSGAQNGNDFMAFLNFFAAQSPVADADGSGDLNVNDFMAFLNAFAAGCSP